MRELQGMEEPPSNTCHEAPSRALVSAGRYQRKLQESEDHRVVFSPSTLCNELNELISHHAPNLNKFFCMIYYQLRARLDSKKYLEPLIKPSLSKILFFECVLWFQHEC